MRSAPNTLVYSSKTLPTWAASKVTTGSVASQTHIYHIGDPKGGTSTEQVFVLCQDGTIRYSADGGDSWAARGNLPAPGNSGLPSYSRYVAIDRDSNGAFWTITNTSYCYKSTNKAVTWAYTGNIGVNDVASMACPNAIIPEFDSVLIPAIGTLFIVFFASAGKRRRRRSRTNP